MGDDESTCPPFEVFDECDSLEKCHWTEESQDNLNFVIKPVADLNNGDYLHGPHVDPENSTDGNIVFVINENPENPDLSG